MQLCSQCACQLISKWSSEWQTDVTSTMYIQCSFIMLYVLADRGARREDLKTGEVRGHGEASSSKQDKG